MQKIIFLILSGFLALGLGAATAPNSPEDFAAGKKRLDEMRQTERQPVLSRPHMFVRSQTKYSGRLYIPSHYNFDDRPLFANRRLWEAGGSDHKLASFIKTFELYRLCGLDGYATFAWPGVQQYHRVLLPLYQAVEKAGLNPSEFNIILESGSGKNYMEIVPETLKLITDNPYSFRVNGKSLISSYVIDNLSPEQIGRYLDRLRGIGGDRILFLPQIHFIRLQNSSGKRLNAQDFYAIYRQHGTLPLSLIRQMEEYLRSYLTVCDGLYLGHFSTHPDDSLDEKFSDEVLLPIFKSVLAESPYNGKKLFGIQAKTGYTAYYGSQKLSRNGTRTLRGFLESARRFRPDLVIGTEWDELNEDTGFQPLVSKPMSNQRVMRYYMSQFKGEEPTPNPEDDLTIPNLIVSQRRQLIPGELMKIELLNVPDTVRGENYQVRLELTDENGKTVYQTEPEAFNTAELREAVFAPPGEQFIQAQALRTRLTVDYRDRKQVFYTGLPFTIIRPTASADQQYFSTPLRNVLLPREADIQIAGGEVKCRLFSPEKLASIEVMQNSLEQFAYDTKDEYKRNDESRRFYRFNHLYLNNPSRIQLKMNLSVTNAPSLLTFATPKDDDNANMAPTLVETVKTFSPYIGSSNHWNRHQEFSIAINDVPQAGLEVTGERTSGKQKGEKFSWSIPLKELDESGVIAKVFEDGLMLSLEVDGRPSVRPLPLDTDRVDFSRKLHFDQPNAIIAVRAISEPGKVYWSAPYALNQQFSSETRPVYVYSDSAGKALKLDLSANRVPNIKYHFTPKYGNILTTGAGREYYAMIGGYQAAATGFQGLEAAYTPFRLFSHGIFKEADKPAPEWVKDGERQVLKFDGERGNFIMFPNTVFPQRAGFTLTFDVKPEEVKSEQVLLAHQATTFGGLNVMVYNGKFRLTYTHRNLHNPKAPWYTQSRFNTNVPLHPNQWQQVTITYNGSKLAISANDKTESFDLQGTGLYLQSAHFGGRGDRTKDGTIPFFKGFLGSFEVKHWVD